MIAYWGGFFKQNSKASNLKNGWTRKIQEHIYEKRQQRFGKFFGTKWVNTLILCVNYSKIKAENEAVKQNLKGK